MDRKNLKLRIWQFAGAGSFWGWSGGDACGGLLAWSEWMTDGVSFQLIISWAQFTKNVKHGEIFSQCIIVNRNSDLWYFPASTTLFWSHSNSLILNDGKCINIRCLQVPPRSLQMLLNTEKWNISGESSWICKNNLLLLTRMMKWLRMRRAMMWKV